MLPLFRSAAQIAADVARSLVQAGQRSERRCRRSLDRLVLEMSFRYMLRLEDGSDAGEVELDQPANVGEEIRVTGNVGARVRAVVPVEIVE